MWEEGEEKKGGRVRDGKKSNESQLRSRGAKKWNAPFVMRPNGPV